MITSFNRFIYSSQPRLLKNLKPGDVIITKDSVQLFFLSVQPGEDEHQRECLVYFFWNTETSEVEWKYEREANVELQVIKHYNIIKLEYDPRFDKEEEKS